MCACVSCSPSSPQPTVPFFPMPCRLQIKAEEEGIIHETQRDFAKKWLLSSFHITLGDHTVM